MNTYSIENDTNQFKLVEHGVVQNGKHAGEATHITIGYYSTLEALVRAVHNKMILCHGIENVTTAIAAANELVLQAVALINKPGAEALKAAMKEAK